jgi:site-specific recombinase XerC
VADSAKIVAAFAIIQRALKCQNSRRNLKQTIRAICQYRQQSASEEKAAMSTRTSVRQVSVKLHRCGGMTLALALIAATGTFITVYGGLERTCEPKLRVPEPHQPARMPRDLLANRERLEAQNPRLARARTCARESLLGALSIT